MFKKLFSLFGLIVVPLVFSTAQLSYAWDYSQGTLSTPDERGWAKFRSEAVNTRYPKYDKNYQKGRSVFKGLNGNVKLDYCLPDRGHPGKAVSLTRKTITQYRGLQVSDFIRTLRDCDNPNKLILATLDKQDAGLVVYYLHKRYRLRLRQ